MTRESLEAMLKTRRLIVKKRYHGACEINCSLTDTQNTMGSGDKYIIRLKPYGIVSTQME